MPVGGRFLNGNEQRGIDSLGQIRFWIADTVQSEADIILVKVAKSLLQHQLAQEQDTSLGSVFQRKIMASSIIKEQKLENFIG